LRRDSEEDYKEDEGGKIVLIKKERFASFPSQ
jgi:hypothetical protein